MSLGSGSWRRGIGAAHRRGCFLDRKLGTLIVDAGPVERTPSGEEMQRRFNSVELQDGELVSAAERAFLDGDSAGAQLAEEKPKP